MSNRELYKQAFSHLHTDHTLDLEGVKMKMQKKENMTGLRCTRRLLVTTLILVMILAMAGVSYAATDGEVFKNLQVWINGQPASEGQFTENADGSWSADVKEGDKIDMQGDGWESSIDVGDMTGKISGSVMQSGDLDQFVIEVEMRDTIESTGDQPESDAAKAQPENDAAKDTKGDTPESAQGE